MLTLARVSKAYGAARILKEISLEVGPGETLGLVGMSGSGKSTLAHCILGLEHPDGGTISWRGQSLATRPARRAARQAIQPVFQDPRASLNPRWTVRQILGEPLDNWFPALRGQARAARLDELLDAVALTPELLHRNPHELSTGQCQLVCIARALAPEPSLLILDEPLSALDMSVQATLLALLRDLQARKGLGYLFISHDIALVGALCQRVAVLDQGAIVEQGPVASVLGLPGHPSTQALLADSLTMPEWAG